MPKPKSRTQRWNEALQEARQRLDDLVNALGELQDVQQEYVEWRDNLPENLQNSTLGEKLNEIADLDLEASNVTSEVEDAISSAEVAEPPLGFGRD